MRILILNWRDIKHPLVGGAERMLYEMAKRWVSWGNQVTWFASDFKPHPPEADRRVNVNETLEGIQFIRRGNSYTVHLHAFFYYLKNLRGKFDIVIDNFHFIPFFTALYVKEKKVALICEVAQEVWNYMSPIPFLGKFGRIFEKTLMFAPYKNVPFLTISNSTRSDLVNFGMPKKNIRIIPMGLSLPQKLPTVEKEKTPTLIFVGRLAKTKGVEDAIKTIADYKTRQACLRRQGRATTSNIRLWIVGKGQPGYVERLKQLVSNLNLKENIKFLGFLPEKEKFERMARANLILVPSVREGWGLIVPEAGSVGTPAVVYNSPGLCDVVENGATGLICQENTPENLAQNALKLLQNKNLYEQIRENAIKKSESMTWDKTAKFVYEAMRV